MISGNIILALTDDNQVLAHMFDTRQMRSFFNDLSRNETIYGPGSAPAENCVRRHLGESVVQYWHMCDAQYALTVGENTAVPDAVRAWALALAAGVALPGADGSAPTDNSDGGIKERIPTAPARRPPGGNAVNPLAELLGSAAA